jgi:VanZ family protein
MMRPLRSAPVWATVVLSVIYLHLATRAHAPRVLSATPDFVVHGGAYALLGFLAAESAVALGLPLPVWTGWGYAVGHGAALEVAQQASPPRHGEVSDVIADAVGAAIGVVAWMAWKRRR